MSIWRTEHSESIPAGPGTARDRAFKCLAGADLSEWPSTKPYLFAPSASWQHLLGNFQLSSTSSYLHHTHMSMFCAGPDTFQVPVSSVFGFFNVKLATLTNFQD